MRVIHSIRARWRVVRRRGPGYAVYLVSGVLRPRVYFWFRARTPPPQVAVLLALALAVACAVLILSMWMRGSVALAVMIVAGVLAYAVRWTWDHQRARQLIASARANTPTSPRIGFLTVGDLEEAGPPWDRHAALLEAEGELGGGAPADLGDCCSVSELPDLAAESTDCGRNDALALVIQDGLVLLRRRYRGDRKRFISDWASAVRLDRSSGRPGVYRADEDDTALYLEFRPSVPPEAPRTLGPSPQSATGPAGANRNGLTPSGLTQEAVDMLERTHSQLTTGWEVGPANLVRDCITGEAMWRDMAGATRRRSRSSLRFAVDRDSDRTAFNQAHGWHLMTEESARDALSTLTSSPNPEARGKDWYGAIDFGFGLTVGTIWTTDSGTGRWDYLNRHVITPLVDGARVLDLGSNNGVMPIMMLRAGARQVTGVELSAEHVVAARTVHRIFEWRDMTRYDLTVVQSGMLEFVRGGLHDFDVLTALCSLYYLSTEEMLDVIRRAASCVPTIVLQANVEAPQVEAASESGAVEFAHLVRRDGTIEKSSVEFLRFALEHGGYEEVEIHAPRGFSRPLLVGKRARGEGRTRDRSHPHTLGRCTTAA